jgi:hypothetical protein
MCGLRLCRLAGRSGCRIPVRQGPIVARKSAAANPQLVKVNPLRSARFKPTLSSSSARAVIVVRMPAHRRISETKRNEASPQDQDNSASTARVRKSRHLCCCHGKRRTLCSECGFMSLCSHNRQKIHCKEGRPKKFKSLCKHGRQKSRRVNCKGVGAL